MQSNEIPDYSKVKFSDNVKLRKFDQFGLSVEGYDYSQHYAKKKNDDSEVYFLILIPR